MNVVKHPSPPASAPPISKRTERRYAIRIRLYPTPEQAAFFRRTVGICRAVYNTALEQRRDFWRNYRAEHGKNVSYKSQAGELKALKAAFPWIAEAPHHCLQQALKDVDRAYVNFFEGRADYPTPRKKYRNDSFRYPDPKQFRLDTARTDSRGRNTWLVLPKAGRVRCVLHRPIPETARVTSVTITREGDWWMAALAIADTAPAPAILRALETVSEAVGVDLGIKQPAALSTGEIIAAPRKDARLRRKEKRLRQALARCKRGSKNRRKARQALARFEARLARRRKDHLEKVTTRLAKTHGLIVLETLQLRNMTASARGTEEEPGRNVRQKAGLNRSILDLSPGTFRRRLEEKGLLHGALVVAVDPRNTSRTCHACGHVDVGSRVSRDLFVCTACGHEADADVNAARNILARGLALLGLEAWSPDAIEQLTAGGRSAAACGDLCEGMSTKQEVEAATPPGSPVL